MKTLKVLTRVLSVLVLVLLAMGLSASPSVALGTEPGGQAVGAASGGPVPGGPGYVILSGFDFKPYEQTASYQYIDATLQNPGTGFAFYVTPVHLPQGATVNQVVAYYFDADSGASNNISVILVQVNNLIGATGIMATISSSGALADNTFTVTSAIATPVVNNALYSYAVEVGLPNSSLIGLEAVRVDYAYPVSLPLLKK